ncbi:hypothetical protein NS201_15690 [Pseudomonas oryzihabitans]|nr:hypothetical protein NS201_15690 [Pseudomonas psychrotolerans]
MSELEQKKLAEPQEAGDGENTPINPATLGWGLAAIAVAIFMIVFNHSAMVLGAGFFAKCVAVAVGAVLGWLGALIGDAIRRFAQPDAVFTNGGILQLIWIKVFWALGPQVIGLFIGVSLGASLVLR